MLFIEKKNVPYPAFWVYAKDPVIAWEASSCQVVRASDFAS